MGRQHEPTTRQHDGPAPASARPAPAFCAPGRGTALGNPPWRPPPRHFHTTPTTPLDTTTRQHGNTTTRRRDGARARGENHIHTSTPTKRRANRANGQPSAIWRSHGRSSFPSSLSRPSPQPRARGQLCSRMSPDHRRLHRSTPVRGELTHLSPRCGEHAPLTRGDRWCVASADTRRENHSHTNTSTNETRRTNRHNGAIIPHSSPARSSLPLPSLRQRPLSWRHTHALRSRLCAMSPQTCRLRSSSRGSAWRQPAPARVAAPRVMNSSLSNSANNRLCPVLPAKSATTITSPTIARSSTARIVKRIPHCERLRSSRAPMEAAKM